MKITWALYLEDGPVDPDELHGDIFLEHEGITLTDGPTLLDSWFEGLIDGYRQLWEGHERVEVDLLVEPYLLLFEMTEDGVRIAYHSMYLPPVSLPDFYQALTDSATMLVAKVEADATNRDFTMIQSLIEFIGR